MGGHLESGESYPGSSGPRKRPKNWASRSTRPRVCQPVHEFVWRLAGRDRARRLPTGSRTAARSARTRRRSTRCASGLPEELRGAAGDGVLTPMLEHELALLGVLGAASGPGPRRATAPERCSTRPTSNPDAGGALPAEPPQRAAMNPATRSLHDAIDATMRRLGQPYLHPDGETLQLDLFGSEPMVRWQERKAAAVFLAGEAWSDLPQTYGRYGTESGRLLLAEVRRLEHAAGALLTDGGMQACALACDVLFAPGSHAVVTRSVYNKTKSYLQRLAGRQGGEVTLVDDGDLRRRGAGAAPRQTTVLFTETYTNPHTRAVDPPALAAVAARARAAGAGNLRVVVDNTIATAWGLREPLLSVARHRRGGGQRHQGARRPGPRHVGLRGQQPYRPGQ